MSPVTSGETSDGGRAHGTTGEVPRGLRGTDENPCGLGVSPVTRGFLGSPNLRGWNLGFGLVSW